MRVVNKSGVLLSHDGLKKYFTLLLVDNTGEIRAVAFGNDVDRLHPLFRVNINYYNNMMPSVDAYSTVDTISNNRSDESWF